MADCVAVVAQPRERCFQRELVDRAVRIVAAQAILAHRFVLEQKWSALLGVTLVASVVDRIFLQERLGRTAVRVMAVGAHNLGFPNRPGPSAEDLSAPVRVALATRFGPKVPVTFTSRLHPFHQRSSYRPNQTPHL